jgi:DNA-binding MarR family transcriptional regulator
MEDAELADRDASQKAEAGSCRQTANILGALALLIQDRVQTRWQEELGLSPMAAATLIQVEWESGCSIELAARYIGLSHSATVRIVDKLVEAGLVSKDRTDKDARVQSLKLTRAGKRIEQQLHAARNKVTDELLSLLPPQQVDALGSSIGTILRGAVTDPVESYTTCRVCDENRCQVEICPIQVV